MKITIIGSSGSGKSMLARNIHKKFNVPHFEIDRVWFRYGGHDHLNNSSSEQKEIISQKILAEVEQFLLTNDNWVFDGTYSKIQPIIANQADVVVLIQRPLLKRIYSHIVRVLKGKDRHPEVTPLQDLLFTKTLLKRWKKQEDVKLDEFSKQYEKKLVVLKSFKEIDKFFESLK